MKLKKYLSKFVILLFINNLVCPKTPPTDKVYIHKALNLSDLNDDFDSIYNSMVNLFKSKENWDKFRVVDPRIISDKFPGNTFENENVGVELTDITPEIFEVILKNEKKEIKSSSWGFSSSTVNTSTKNNIKALIGTLKGRFYDEDNPVYKEFELKESKEDSISFYKIFPEFKQWKIELQDPKLYINRSGINDFGNYSDEQIKNLKDKFETEFKSKIAIVAGDQDWHIFPIKIVFNIEKYEGGQERRTPFGMQNFGGTSVTSFEIKLRSFRDEEKIKIDKDEKEQKTSSEKSDFQNKILNMNGERVEIVLNDYGFLQFTSDVSSTIPSKDSHITVGGSFLLNATKHVEGIELSLKAFNDKFFMIDSSGKRKLQDDDFKFIYFYDYEYKQSYLKAKDSGIILDLFGYHSKSPEANTGVELKLSSLKEDQEHLLRSVFVNDKFVSYRENYPSLASTYSTRAMDDDLFTKILLKIEESFSLGSSKKWSSDEIESLNKCLNVYWPKYAIFVTDIERKIFEFKRDVLAREFLFNPGTFKSNLEWAKIYLDGVDNALFEETVEKMLEDDVSGMIKIDEKTGFEKLREFLIQNQNQIKKISDTQTYQSWLEALDGKANLSEGESLAVEDESVEEFADAQSLQESASVNIQEVIDQVKVEAVSVEPGTIQVAGQKINLLKDNKESLTPEQVHEVNRIIEENSSFNEAKIEVTIYDKFENYKNYVKESITLSDHLIALSAFINTQATTSDSDASKLSDDEKKLLARSNAFLSTVGTISTVNTTSVSANNVAQEFLDFIISPLGYLGKKQKTSEAWTEDDSKEFKKVLEFLENNFSKNKAVVEKVEKIKNMLSSEYWFSRELITDLFEKLKQEYQAIAYKSEKKNDQEFISVLKKIYAQKVDARLTDESGVTESSNLESSNLGKINAFLESVNYELLSSQELKTEFINLKGMLSQYLTLEEILERMARILKVKIGKYEADLFKGCHTKLKDYKRDISSVKKKQILALIEKYNSIVSTDDSISDFEWVKEDLNPTFDTFLSGFSAGGAETLGVKEEFDDNSDGQGLWSAGEKELLRYWNWLKRYPEWKPNLNLDKDLVPLKMLILRTQKSAEFILENEMLLEDGDTVKLNNLILQTEEELERLA